jgi:hypothetical protein
LDHLRILAITQDLWGERIADNIDSKAPEGWVVERWAAPPMLPLVIDDPSDFLPSTFPEADLVLALGKVPGLAQLVPDIAAACGAQAVIAPIDRNESLPPGLANQLKGWLEQQGLVVAFPKPFCSLTEATFNALRVQEEYDHPVIRTFASAFGNPEFEFQIRDKTIVGAEVKRDSACGCAAYVADNLVGSSVADALDKAGMLHHHYPCLASMNQDADYSDTLMHVSGNILKEAIKTELEPHLEVKFMRPTGLSEDGEQ